MNQYFRGFITYAQEIDDESEQENGDGTTSQLAIAIKEAVMWRAIEDEDDQADTADELATHIWAGYLQRFYDLADQLDAEFNAAFPTGENKEGGSVVDIKILDALDMTTPGGEPFLAKRLHIRDLPDCYHKERLLEITISPEVSVWVVGKPGHPGVGDWAAYIGHPMPYAWKSSVKEQMAAYAGQNLNRPEGVCRYGAKLHKDTAEILFPEYKELKYRP